MYDIPAINTSAVKYLVPNNVAAYGTLTFTFFRIRHAPLLVSHLQQREENLKADMQTTDTSCLTAEPAESM